MAERRVAVVTGANKGIGLEIAHQLARMGVTVYLGARDEARGRAAAEKLRAEGLDARPLSLDVTDERSVAAAAALLERDAGRLDILVNNAGIFVDDGPPSRVSADSLRRTYETNVFGVVRVTQALLPLLRRSDAGRIVNMSSGLGSITQNSDPRSPFAAVKCLAYNSSKSALNAITVQFAHELRDTPIKVNAADPGYVATDMNRHQGVRSVAQGAATPVRLATLPSDGPTGGYFNDAGSVPW
ncbi:MAG TPA: SDR family oxidoreductase [Myxococcota bacterium]|jgi:NAD(P)-dependent dehydrogenase (short-subunit alcohol dehydrogenase family)|nr:SDR family oxidoreductase [Myxococcota bacterium]